MLISIIVPIYNSDKYIKNCIDSILEQTYTNWELILVDDCSIDKSIKICRDYAKKDERIKLILSEHKGSLGARKIGVECSTGEYCVFVDSDDVIVPELIETVFPLVENMKLDILNYGMKSVKNGIEKKWEYGFQEGIYEQEKLEVIYRSMMFDFVVSSPGIIQSLCTKVVKKKLLQKAMESIDERITLGDDAAVVYTMFLLASKIAIINKPLYHYQTHDDSLITKKDEDIFCRIKYFQDYMEFVFSGVNKEYALNIQLKAYIILLLRMGIKNNFEINIRQKYELPFELNELGEKIAIYGAGAVGRSYYRQLKKNKNVEVVAWLDKNMEGKEVFACRILSQTEIVNINFDQIIIAVKDFDISEIIKEQLAQLISVRKIIWRRPKEFWWEQEIDI